MIVDLDRAVRRLNSDGTWGYPEPLSAYRYSPAYVLLGDPGAGKSTAFAREQCATPRSAPVTARDFRTYGDALPARTETLFIDGLDEARAGGGDPRGPFDQIRRRLIQLTPMPVRLSCRELDWLGDNDRTNLSKVVPGGEVIVLRLEPLNADEQRLIIGADPRIADPDDFILEAADRGVESLLTNAQTLALLIRVVAEKKAFPEGRTQTFEEACRLLAQEPNDEHRIAAQLPKPETLVGTAGYMCAVSLLSGSVGFSVPNARESVGFVPASLFGASAESVERAAHTRLFTSIGGGHFVPVHANIAAFLAAQHLAGLVDGQVPGRIVALLTGNDGFPPTPLRSLVAWLAVTSSTVRRTLIERDPVAVLTYGDVRKFKADERAFLLEKIAEDPSRLYEGLWPDSALAGLASADMEPTLRGVLTDPDRSDAKQKVAELVVGALTQTPASEGMADVLLDVCRDESRWSGVREFALDAWIHSLADDPTRTDRLRVVLGEIRDGSIEDYGGELLGTLLRELYPGAIGPADLWQCFRIPDEPLLGRFHRFWDDLPDTCPEDDLPAHLDYLATSRGITHTGPDLTRPSDLPVRFLARAVETRGERVEASRLVTWLRVGLDPWGMLRPEGVEGERACVRVCKWLEAHPAIQKAVTRVALRTEQFRKMESVEYHLNELLYRSKLPEDMGAWHLDEAVVAEDAALTTKHLVGFTRSLARRPVAVDATLEDARHRLQGRLDALRVLDNLLSSRLHEGHLIDQKRRQHIHAEAALSDISLLRAVQSEEHKLETNCASPGLLHYLAQKYYRHRQVHGSPGGREHLVQALGNDERLADLALGALRRTIERDDLPSAEDLVRLRRENLVSAFVWPVLIGLDDRVPADVTNLDERPLRAALACRLLAPGLADGAEWYHASVRNRPELVADVLVLVGRVLLASGEMLFSTHPLGRDEEHGLVARAAAVPLLRAFPVRARSDRLHPLENLLTSALRFAEPAAFRDLLDSKLRAKSMTAAQRTRWLVAALLVDPERFRPELEAHVAESEVRIREVASSCLGVFRLRDRLEPEAVAFLIRKVGASCQPYPPLSGGRVFDVNEQVELTEGLIRELGGRPDAAAGECLRRLLIEERLGRWRPALESARDAQRVAQRDTSYSPPTPAEVIASLGNGPPANAADLRELIVNRLQRVADEVRTTSDNLWRHFWTEDKRDNRPKDEDACRDTLRRLMLAPSLPAGCDAQSEGQYASNRRSDIRVAFGQWNIPIEIKKNSHRNVWSAVRNQLLPRYANDPATEGLGIYLVLWFGAERTAGVPRIQKPATPDEMLDRLLADLTSDEHRRAAIVVMDVTPPSPTTP